MTIRPFTIETPDSALADLKRRLERTRWPDQIPGSRWDYGADSAYMRELAGYWQTGFDWRRQERMLNEFDQFKAEIDGQDVHFVRRRGRGPNPIPLLLLHGWPSTFFEFYKIVGPLADPAAHGGDPADAFDIVAPSLPGYGFSDAPQVRGAGVAWIADRLGRLMTGVLGYERFAAHGGDWGAAVTNRLAVAFPRQVIGIHVTRALARGAPSPKKPLSPEAQQRRERLARFQREEYGYAEIQRTKPQSLAYGLNDSPVGLAAWIVEKWRRWTDCGGEVERVFTKDELLTNVMIYWLSGAINSSARLYYEEFHQPTRVPKGQRIDVPMGAAFFPKDFAPPPRQDAERVYSDIRRWTVFQDGGHFPALEKPDVLVDELRAFFQPLRS